MCGIAGFFHADRVIGVDEARARLQRMCDSLAHRGPDGAGVQVLPGSSCLAALGHRRLAVVDLSPAGAQPMQSQDGRFTLVYNGEIYALQALRARLVADGYVFRGHSDTEIMLEYMARYGVEAALPLFEGMFAFALWDQQQQTLTLARDRAGIKPLYWSDYQGVFGFASELKALYPLWPQGKPPVSPQGQLLFAHHGYIPAPHTIHQQVYKLKPGHVMTIKAGAQAPVIKTYWQWGDQAAAVESPIYSAADSGDLVAHAHDVLSESVRITLDADVPVGCFLSGGIDSSLVSALMQSHVSRPVKTFAIGFEEQAFNEAPYARAVAEHLGTDHTELILSESDMLNVVPLMTQIYDEPFADSSQIPTYLVSKLARTQVAVSLSGDGGDELFLGYTRYRDALRAARVAAITPRFLRAGLRARLARMRSLIGGPSRTARYMRLLASPGFEHLYDQMMSYDVPLQHDAETMQQDLCAPADAQLGMLSAAADKMQFMRRFDFQNYMVDDVLTKVDRASMAVSLESRVPLLNNRVLDLAARLPVSALINGDKGKLILRDVLARYVPRPLFERPKMGFGVPMASWIRGPLKEMVHDRLEIALAGDHIFDAVRVRRAFAQHGSGAADHSYILWLVSSYGAWKAQSSL